jgi:uncharacterized protein
MLVGVISDTHGVLPEAVMDAFRGVDRIVHAGDVGPGSILDELGTVAPLIAVRGNTDDCARSACLRPLVNVPLGPIRALVVHRPQDVPDPLPEGVRVVITGHTHVPKVEQRAGVLWVNPGSASRARSGSGHNVALLSIDGDTVSARLIAL